MGDYTSVFDDAPVKADLEAKLATKGKLTYDQAAKLVLSNKRIIAEILHAVVPEFMNTPIKAIMSQLKSGINESKVECLATESAPEDMATIRLDLDIQVRGAISKALVEIDIEPQGKTSPGYSLYKRAMYYASRMIDRQLSQGDNNYDKLHKCYSVWICFQKDEVTDLDILQYKMQTLDSVLTATDKAKTNLQIANRDIDLINVVFVFVPTKYSANLVGIQRTLYGIFYKDLQIVNELFTPNEWKVIESEVSSMSELERELVDLGVQKGIQQGREEGIQAFILMLTELKLPGPEIIYQIMQKFSLTREHAEEYYSKFISK